MAATLALQSCLHWAAFDAQAWHQLIEYSRPDDLRRGTLVTACGDGSGPPRQRATTPDFNPASCTPLLSQADPSGSRAITARPTSPELRMLSNCMRGVLLRRSRLPLAMRQGIVVVLAAGGSGKTLGRYVLNLLSVKVASPPLQGQV